jgi:hypothetical protein
MSSRAKEKSKHREKPGIDRRRRLWSALAILGIILLAGALRLWGIGHSLPDMTVEDEFQIVERALHCGTGDLNPHLFTWPGSLPIYLTFIVYALYALLQFACGYASSLSDFAREYFSNPTPFFILARLLAAGFGIWAIWETYRATARSYSRYAGLLSALVLALCWGAIRSSHIALADIFTTIFLPLALISTERFWQEEKLRWIFAAGLALGVGISAKYNLAFLGPALICAPFLAPGLSRKRRIFSILWLVAGGCLGFIITCPFSILDFPSFSHDLLITFQRMASSRHGAFSLQHGYLLGMVLPYSMSWTLLIAGALGFIRALWKHSRMDILLVIFISIYVIVAGGRWAPPNHLLPLVGALAILAGRALADLSGWISRRFAERKAVWKGKILFGVVLAVFMVYPLLLDSEGIQEYTYLDGRAQARLWIEENIPAGSSILIDSAAPDVDSPQLLPDKATMLELVANGKGAGRYRFFLESEQYPFGRPTYRLYLRPWAKGGAIEFIQMHQPDYVVTTEFIDRGHYFDQILLPGDDHYEGEGEYHQWLADNLMLINVFGPSFGEASGANVYIYKVK